MSAQVLRFARLIANTVHECAPDHSTHVISVGELREAVAEMTELYEALKALVSEANGFESWQRPYATLAPAMAALAKARGDQ